MSKFLKQLLALEKTITPEMDFHTRTRLLIETWKRDRQENPGGDRKHLLLRERMIRAAEGEYRKSLTWFPLDKIEGGLDKIEGHPDFVKQYEDWKERILLRFYRFAVAKFVAGVLRRLYPSTEKKYNSGIHEFFDFMSGVVDNDDPKKPGRTLSKNAVKQIKKPYGL